MVVMKVKFYIPVEPSKIERSRSGVIMINKLIRSLIR